MEDIIRREHIVTLPDRAMNMRIASEAETAAQPAPHMDPPPLIGNKGERGTFVLTMGNPGKAGASEGYDDFNHPYATWTLNLPTSDSTMKGLGGVGYDAAHQLVYVSQLRADPDGYADRAVIHVFKIQ